MKYTNYDMNAYNLHIINTDKFKTITVGIAFRRKTIKEEITIRNLLKEMMVNATKNYPTEKSLIIATEELYDLKLLAANYRIGNYAIMTFRTRFLNEKYTEPGMNQESIKFLLDLIFNPKLDTDIDKCKKKIEKSIKTLKDNKIRYSLSKLLETTESYPYSYNAYGYLEDLSNITQEDIESYYKSIIKNDIADIFVVGEVDEIEIKQIFKEYFKVTTFHKQECDVIVPELTNSKVKQYREYDRVNQTQLSLLYRLSSLTEKERKYVMPVYAEMIGGSANSILFDSVREKNSYAYYVNAGSKSYDNVMLIYSGIEQGNEKKVTKIIEKTLSNISKGIFDEDKFKGAKETIISAIKASEDTPMGIITNYYAMTLVNSKNVNERIKNISAVTREDIINISKKINLHTIYILEDNKDEKDNHK